MSVNNAWQVGQESAIPSKSAVKTSYIYMWVMLNPPIPQCTILEFPGTLSQWYHIETLTEFTLELRSKIALWECSNKHFAQCLTQLGALSRGVHIMTTRLDGLDSCVYFDIFDIAFYTASIDNSTGIGGFTNSLMCKVLCWIQNICTVVFWQTLQCLHRYWDWSRFLTRW